MHVGNPGASALEHVHMHVCVAPISYGIRHVGIPCTDSLGRILCTSLHDSYRAHVPAGYISQAVYHRSLGWWRGIAQALVRKRASKHHLQFVNGVSRRPVSFPRCGYQGISFEQQGGDPKWPSPAFKILHSCIE